MAEQGTSIIILAGGFGTRMKSQLPKVMHKICGKEMLFHIIDESKEISDDIHIILYNQADFVQEQLAKRYSNLTIHIQDYENYPGTAGAIMQGSKNIANPKSLIPLRYNKVLVLSGDMPLVKSDKLREFIEPKCDIAMGILELEDASGYGRVIIQGDRVEEIIEEKDATCEIKKINLANAGIYCFNKALLDSALQNIESNNNQKEFYLTDVIKQAKHIIGIRAKEEVFMGVNSKVELAKAEEIMRLRILENAMKEGVIIRIPQSVYIECDVEFEGECEIENGVVLKGKSKIKNSKILSHSIVESSVIENSTIGPFSRIRPDSHVLDSNIGNFVEVKASKLNGVKAGHLSYIGDSEIDSGTNVGAGVITCNYDGISKHKTIIGKNVFIGSDSQLIAPLNIESNVIIASGSTVTNDARDGDLVISRTKQVNKGGFFYRFFARKKIKED